ncbi:MAG: hypothetical protein H3C27_11585, partial [Opitutaceae bacterium]|nr:hypothetical protein [Opitutaceae bacterium]
AFELTDPSLSLGLGAIIGAIVTGIVAILLPYINYNKEVIADRRSRRLRLLEEAMINFELHTEFLSKKLPILYKYHIYLNLKDRDESELERRYISLENINKEQQNSEISLNKAVGRLDLLRCHKTAEMMRHMHIVIKLNIDKIKDIESDNNKIENIYNTSKDLLKKQRREILVSLGKLYSSDTLIEPESHPSKMI